MTPFFTIIIPLFNSGATLRRTLESVLTQTFTKYELVFIDGDSVDDTIRIITDFRVQNPDVPIKFISEKDQGIYDAMNKGIKLASGEWIYFMGSDDTLASAEVLQDVYDELAITDEDLIYGNVYGEKSGKSYIYDTTDKVLSTGIHHQSIFYKHHVFDILGNYDLAFKIAADYDFTLKIFLNDSFTTRYINQNIACYGEGGFSSLNFDYKFFSSHYRILASSGKLENIGDAGKCLDNSIYCCFYLARTKKNMGWAWKNILYYITIVKGLTPYFRLKTFVLMLMWTLKAQ